MDMQTSNRLEGIGEYYFSQKLREIDQLNKDGKQIINLGIGSPDLAPHPDVIKVLQETSAADNVHAYQSYKGSPILRNAISEFYKKWYDEFISDVPIGAIVYIKASPEICLKRVNIRAREGENIPLEYLKECDKYHDEWINSENIPKLVIDADIDLKTNPEANFEILKQIDTFIHSL